MNTHGKRTFLTVVVAGAVLVLAGITAALVWGVISVARLGGELHEVKASKAESDAKVSALSAQVESLGGEPVVEPDPTPTTTTVEALSTEQVRAIVAEELIDRDINLTDAQISKIAAIAARQIPKPKDGKDGKPGADGKTPTPAQIRQLVEQVVTAMCANDACKGEPGEDGQDGQDGAPGRDGEPGPAPTDEQLDAALARYCETRDNCRGPAGKDGDQGPPGERGPGIAAGPDFVRDENGQCLARTIYDDGTVYTSTAGDAACPPPATPTPE